MIDSKQAVQQALQNLYDLVGPREIANYDGIHLEEVELTEDSKHWNVTLSYPVKKDPEDDSGLPENLTRFMNSPKRKWRVFKIGAEDGSLFAMKVPASS